MIFFYKWIHLVQIDVPGVPVDVRTREASYISNKTHNNLNVLCKGYIEYARNVLSDADVNEYVPALHSNQSSIENHFSCIRAMDKDRTDVYGTGVVHTNMSVTIKCTTASKGNSSYPTDVDKGTVISQSDEIIEFLSLKRIVLEMKDKLHVILLNV